MKIAIFTICSLIIIAHLTLASVKDLDGIRDLVKQHIPKHVSSFLFELIDGPGDLFVVSDSCSKQDAIDIKCTLTSTCAWGLYECVNRFFLHIESTSISSADHYSVRYLRRRAGVGIWWTGSRLDQLPSHLPPVGDVPIQGSSIVKYRYYFNTVTFSYTTVFWPFDEMKDLGSDNWSYLLDWLALHGVNLPLAWNGHEYILSEVSIS